ncbi:cutinase family protein [Nocardia takedensis]|uniref:cutinase family protein n=1 Tax=Nocardia takedensis TaxID=259390 RepID=UPI003F76FE26
MKTPAAVRAVATLVVALCCGVASAHAQPPTDTAAPTTTSSDLPCTALHVVAFHGSRQTGANTDATVDSGWLGDAITRPLLQAAPGDVSRQSLAYAGDFQLEGTSYPDTMRGAIALGLRAIGDYAGRCPSSKIALVGHSQGAQVADEIARTIGAGSAGAPVRADRIAAVSLFTSPVRPNEAPLFGGGAQQLSPAVPAGVAQSALSELVLGQSTPTPGGGVAEPVSTLTDYGPLAARVASWCAGGDLGCSIPANTSMARIVSNLGSQVQFTGQDPLRTVADLATALGGSVLRTAADVVNNDVNFSGGHFGVTSSGTTILGQLADNTAPRAAATAVDNDVIRAIIKVGVMGFQAAVTVAQRVLNPATIAELVAVGLTNPGAALADLGTKLAGAALELVPPATIDQGIRYVFNEVSRDVSDNAGLVAMATDLRYWDSARQSSSYDKAPVAVGGQTAAGFTVDWFATLAKALAHNVSGSATPTASTTITRSSTAPPGR